MVESKWLEMSTTGLILRDGSHKTKDREKKDTLGPMSR